MIRDQIITELKKHAGLENDELSWASLCKHTYFDSFVTAMAHGLNWNDSNMATMPIGSLKMALFNMVNFPKVCGHCKHLHKRNEVAEEGLCTGCNPHSTVDFDMSCGVFRNPRLDD